MKVLIIEDHQHKIDELQKFIEELDVVKEFTIKKSYHSGLKEVITGFRNYDLLLLDMSMHNYDISTSESGGDPIPLAGKLIMSQMFNRGINTKTIVVTMFESFGDLKIQDLDINLRKEFSDFYLGYVYFSASDAKWKTDLKRLLTKITSHG